MENVGFERELYVASNFPSMAHFTPLRRQRTAARYLFASREALRNLMTAVPEYNHLRLPFIGDRNLREESEAIEDPSLNPLRPSRENYFKPLESSPLAKAISLEEIEIEATGDSFFVSLDSDISFLMDEREMTDDSNESEESSTFFNDFERHPTDSTSSSNIHSNTSEPLTSLAKG